MPATTSGAAYVSVPTPGWIPTTNAYEPILLGMKAVSLVDTTPTLLPEAASLTLAATEAPPPPPRLILRLLGSGDAAAFVDLYVKAPPQDRQSRFCGGVSENFVRTYAERAMNSATELLGLFEDGRLRAAAEVYVDQEEAELSFLVAPDAQCKGMGSMLMAAGLSVAHERGASNALVMYSPNNTAMHRVARVNGLRRKFSDMECCAEVQIDQECDAHFPSFYQLQHVH